MDDAAIRRMVEAFAHAAQRAQRIGLDAIEMHSAHGYLLHEFLSPISNQRKDRYGGSLENRMRAPLEVAEALRASWPKERCLGARITAGDWADGGFGVEDAVAYASKLKKVGFNYACVSTGGVASHQKIKVVPGYQVPHAAAVKQGSGIATRAVGMIVDFDQAEEIVASGKADMVALARGFLDNPRWVWHAAEHFGVKIDVPPQYSRAVAQVWPGAKLARPQETQAA
jgi:NADPH2 dehydrogenase